MPSIICLKRYLASLSGNILFFLKIPAKDCWPQFYITSITFLFSIKIESIRTTFWWFIRFCMFSIYFTIFTNLKCSIWSNFIYVLIAIFLWVFIFIASETIENVPLPMCESILYFFRFYNGERNSLIASCLFLKASSVWTT